MLRVLFPFMGAKMDDVQSYELSSIDEIITAAKNGEVFILVDDEDRENEGDVCVLAEFATPEAINFMAKYARGLICLAMDRSRVEQLGLPLMQKRHESRHETAFTVSIEARDVPQVFQHMIARALFRLPATRNMMPITSPRRAISSH